MMGAETLNGLVGDRSWMRDSKGISYGQPSNAIVEWQSQRSSLAVPSAPKNEAKREILAIKYIRGYDR